MIDKATRQPVLLFPEGAVHLSETAYAILKQCDGHASLGAILTALSREFEADEATLRQDVIECLTEFRQRKLIVLD